uniref:NADH-ubiquinone oxidoreductase chain 5 n=1 Tax=Semele scabra TaxID=1125679 RepID=I6NHU2_9BIVA|nr:NADH dehydrogenase subunit 5 [Semele scabra]AEV94308.1 NADH dehydrogenase subunit 5 [Semele scabra]
MMDYKVKVWYYFSILFWLFVSLCWVGFHFIFDGGSVVFDVSIFGGLMSLSVPFMLDLYSCLFSIVVVLISSSVMLYNGFYMDGEVFYSRFCKLVLLFVLSMLLLVFIPNLLGLMLGWDGLGITSYLLVIYYQDKRSLGSGTLTVLSNRVGDVLFFVGIGMGSSMSSWNFVDLSGEGVCSLLCGAVVLGGMTKSAQMPFSAWLPAAMAAPSPVSALVHSSTLVTAGVYVLVRFSGCLFGGWYLFLGVVCSMTMFMSAVSAVFEPDVKKVVALSTLSQLGVMMLSLSVGAVSACFFHLVSHALFKALMFLCVGAVIHFSGVQDLRYLGGFLYGSPVVTGWLVVSCLSLMGFPFMAGFYSKDLVLESFFVSSMSGVLFVLVVVSTCLTVLYSGLMVLSLVRFSMYEGYKGVMVSGAYVMFPCSVLGVGSLFGGLVMQYLVLEFNASFVLVGYVKMVPIVCVCLGIMGVLVYKVTGVLNTYTGLNLGSGEVFVDMLAKMWYMPQLSSDLFSGFVLEMSGNVKGVVEDGYLEYSFGSELVWKGSSLVSMFYMKSQDGGISVCFLKGVVFVFIMFMASYIYGAV